VNDARGAVTGEAGTAPPRPIGEDPPGEASEDARDGARPRAPDEVPPDAAAPLDEPDEPTGATPEREPEAPLVGPADAADDAPQDDAPQDDVPDGRTAPVDPPTESAEPPSQPAEPPEPPLDASVHAHVLEDPLPPPGPVDTAETPLFADTFPRYARLRDPSGDAATDIPVDRRPTGAATLAVAPTTAVAAGTIGPERHTHVGPSSIPLRRRRWFRRTVAVLLVLLLLGLAALATYLFRSAQAWRDRAESYLDTSLDIGDELAGTQGQLSGSQAELEAVRAQLATTHQRIVELADEKNQALDDWEITQQLVDYQQRVSDAAGQVALALDQCVQGQQELIGYLQASAEPGGPVYDPIVLAQFETDVEALCQAASEANIALQRELAR
jgi:hypothetical protein